MTGRPPSDRERAAFHELAFQLGAAGPGRAADAYQRLAYDVAEQFGFAPAVIFFVSLGDVVFGNPMARLGDMAEADHRRVTEALKSA